MTTPELAVCRRFVPRGERPGLGRPGARPMSSTPTTVDSGGMASEDAPAARAVSPTRRWRSSFSCCCSRSTGWRSRRSSPTTSCCRVTATVSGSPRRRLRTSKTAVQHRLPGWLWNTVLVSIVSTAFSLAAAVFAAYAIERLRYTAPSRSAWRSFSPTWCRRRSCSSRSPTWCSSSACSDTRWALILTHPDPSPVLHPAADGLLPLDPVPSSRSALIDGATRWQIPDQIVLPLAPCPG